MPDVHHFLFDWQKDFIENSSNIPYF